MERIIANMKLALDNALIAYNNNEVPVGAIIVEKNSNKIIASTYNKSISNIDPCAHAEILAIQGACKILGHFHLNKCDLYVTMEPCAMCAYAISLAKIKRLFFGCYDQKSGGIEGGPQIFKQPTTHHKPEIYGGLMADEARHLLQDFFQQRRLENKL